VFAWKIGGISTELSIGKICLNTFSGMLGRKLQPTEMPSL